MSGHGKGWLPDLPDHRDFMYSVPEGIALPAAVDLTPKCPAVFDQESLGSCFPPGTHVRMADGSERPIEDVRLGEYVVTAEGRTGRVLRTTLRDEADGVVTLSLWGYGALRMTAEHPVLTGRGYVAAADLRTDDVIGLPRYRPLELREKIHVADFISKTERLVKVGTRKMGTLPGRPDTAVTVSSLPEQVELTPRFGRLLGLFLAEGSTSSGKALWTFGAHEADTLVRETVDLLGDLGVVAHVQHRPNNSINVVVYGTAWSRFFSRLCGNGAGNKVPHASLLSGPDDFLRAVLEGWLAGDGYYCRKRGRVQRTAGTSVSKQLALAMYDIAQHFGLRPVLRAEKAKTNRHAKVRRDFFAVETNEHVNDSDWRSSQSETHVWRRVRALEHMEYVGAVYNLSVEGDESYVAEGVGVHNCTANAICAALAFDEIRQGVRPTTRSRLFVYYCERAMEGTIGADSGAMIRDGIKSVASQGVCPESSWPYDIARFARQPTATCYAHALRFEALTYRRLTQSTSVLKGCLASGSPFVFGFTVYESFESDEVARTGVVPMPAKSEKVIGGHAVMCVGYDDATQRFICRNSWGAGWGQSGNFTIPYAYVLSGNLADDLWTISTVGVAKSGAS